MKTVRKKKKKKKKGGDYSGKALKIDSVLLNS